MRWIYKDESLNGVINNTQPNNVIGLQLLDTDDPIDARGKIRKITIRIH